MNVTILTGISWQTALESSGCTVNRVRQAAQSTQPEYEVYYNVRGKDAHYLTKNNPDIKGPH